MSKRNYDNEADSTLSPFCRTEQVEFKLVAEGDKARIDPFRTDRPQRGWTATPLFKWPGGKRSLASRILSHAPASYARLVEPFCGGAAIFFASGANQGWLADANGDLINAYVQVRNRPIELARRLQTLDDSSATYYSVRSSRPRSDLGRAVRFLHLMTHSFNGIYRENSSGQFNVPYGDRRTKRKLTLERVLDASSALSVATLRHQDFRQTIAVAKKGDLLYVDPPYTVLHNNNGFVEYNQKLFSWADQVDLAACCKRAVRRGVFVIVSNADHGEVLDLYPDFIYHQVNRFSSISASAIARKRVSEALLIGCPQ